MPAFSAIFQFHETETLLIVQTLKSLIGIYNLEEHENMTILYGYQLLLFSDTTFQSFISPMKEQEVALQRRDKK